MYAGPPMLFSSSWLLVVVAGTSVVVGVGGDGVVAWEDCIWRQFVLTQQRVLAVLISLSVQSCEQANWKMMIKIWFMRYLSQSKVQELENKCLAIALAGYFLW